MRKRLGVMLAAVAVSGAAIGVSLVSTSGASAPAAPAQETVKVIERAVSDTIVYVRRHVDRPGNLLTFSNPIYGPKDKRRIGHDLGTCVRIDPKAGSWQCSWTTWVGNGSITVSGPFYDTRDSVLAIIGGTGHYSRATGNMELRSRHGGSEYAFTFRLFS
jgi:allene oxide cyclase